MEVHISFDLGKGHKIEFGDSSWDPESFSVRNRYPTKNGDLVQEVQVRCL